MQSTAINLLLIVVLPLRLTHALACQPSSYTDYSSDTVQCTTTCPSSTTARTINRRCLSSKQYLIGDQVHACNGWVDSQASICCGKGEYIGVVNGVANCLKCQGKVYMGGALCCPGSYYVDLSGTGSPRCTQLGTGQCSSITMKNLIQVCCPDGLFYSIQQQKCVNPSAYNCDPTQKICCPFGKKLDNVHTQILCVDTCSWSDNSTFYCRKKYCNNIDQPQKASPTPITQYQRITQQKIALGTTGLCCYGLAIGGACINDASSCLKRFINRGWSACCNAGEFYSLKNSQCMTVCDGIILFEFFCIQQGSILNLLASNGQPSQSPSGTLCNGRIVPDSYPICCPPGFFINSTQGCQYCNGRIFQTSSNQLCCGNNQIYNKNSGKCQPCLGIVNKQGTLCCLSSQYFGYSVGGAAACVDTCADQKLYKGEYCCDGLGQCQGQIFTPTVCSVSYLTDNACQACPSFCSMDSQSCISIGSSQSSSSQCQKSCQPGTIYSPQMQQCLACDISCQACTQPFDAQYCTQCKDGYVYSPGICNRCAPQCLTCSPSINTCTSCPSNSSRPVLYNGRCMPSCQTGQYFDLSTATCLTCSNGCSQCTGPQAFQCSKCPISMFYSTGSCSPCSSVCSICFSSTSRCYQCQPQSLLYLKYDTQQCVPSCQNGYSRAYDPGLGHSACMRCHPSCLACQNSPQNCVACTNANYFMSDETGVNLCLPCAAPCLNCQSSSICLMCQPGFYVQNTKCQPCHKSCQTCTTGLDTGCLSCFGDSQLIQGKCVGCSSSCQKCDINQNCLICKSPYYFYTGNCVSSCPTNSYISNNNICTNCLTNCSSCVNALSCVTCAPLYPIVFQGLCLDVCLKGYELQGGVCVVTKNQTINNHTDYNNTNNNNNSNNNGSNNNNNNGNGNTTTTTKTTIVKSQSIQLQPKNRTMVITTNLDTSLINTNTNTTSTSTNTNNNSSAPPQLQFYLYNTKTGAKVKLSATKLVSIQTNTLVDQASPTSNTNANNNVAYEIAIPPGQIDLKNSILLTSIPGQNNPNSTTYYNAKSIWQFILYDYTNNPLQGLQYVGLTFSILIAIYAVVSKLKGHFLAQQANTIILHLLNFSQVVYLFKFTRMHDQGMYHFLNGFGFMHLLMFPNMFYKIMPEGYQQFPAQKSIIPDANFIRNAGSSISFMVICLLITIIVFIVSYALFIKKDLPQMPQVRKITRLGILAIQITFLNIFFTSLCYLIQPFTTNTNTNSSNTNSYINFTHSSKIAAAIMLAIVILCCVGIIVHFYKTYNSDVLEHYYTLRQGCQLTMMFCQSLIFAFAIGKPLLCLALIPLQIIWLIFNYLLYRYGQGDKISHHIKFIISSVCITVSYLFLSLANQIHWIAIITIISLAVVVLIVYSSYQIVGLYYGMIFRGEGGESVKELGDDQIGKVKAKEKDMDIDGNNISNNNNNRSRNLSRNLSRNSRNMNRNSSRNISNNNVSINNNDKDKESDSRL